MAETPKLLLTCRDLLTSTMPTATSSRRKASRRQMSSDIEEDRPSQTKSNEQVDDEDEGGSRSRRRPTNGVKEKKPIISKQKERDHVNKGEDGDDDDDGRIDIANFRDQPLGRADVAKLQGISRDWGNMERQVRQNWSVVGDVGVSMAEAAEGDDAEKVRLIVLDLASCLYQC